jgi:anti-sigma-K factor RskA
MDMTRRDAAAAVGAALAVGLVFRASDAEADCPNIIKAVAALQAAQTDLKNAAHDYDGHRADALKAVDAALSQLNICLKSAQCT